MTLVPLYHPWRRARLRPGPTDAVPQTPRPRDRNGRRSRRPHADAQVKAVRRLIEESTLTYSQIAAQTGVGRASISRWSRDGGWMRPFDAPRSTDRVPTWRASQRKKLRTLADRLRVLAERHVEELEKAPQVDPDRLMAALHILKIARVEAMGRRRRRKPLWEEAKTGRQRIDERDAIRAAIAELHRGGVNVDAAPKDIVAMVIDAHLPPLDDDPSFREEGRKKKWWREE